MSLSPNQEFLFTRQRHEADRMGLHWDYRFVVGDKAYSFATKKEMPEPGKAILLFEQPVHDRQYALSERVEIPKGQYGAGVTTLDFVHKAKVGDGSTPDTLTIHVNNGQKFLLKKMPDGKFGDKSWLFKNLTAKSDSEMKPNPYLTAKSDSEMKPNPYLEKIAAQSMHELRKDPALRSALAKNTANITSNNRLTESLYDKAFDLNEDHEGSRESWQRSVDSTYDRLRSEAKFAPTVSAPNFKQEKRLHTLAGSLLATAGAGVGTLAGMAGAGAVAVSRVGQRFPKLSSIGLPAAMLGAGIFGAHAAVRGVNHLVNGKENQAIRHHNEAETANYIKALKAKGLL